MGWQCFCIFEQVFFLLLIRCMPFEFSRNDSIKVEGADCVLYGSWTKHTLSVSILL